MNPKKRKLSEVAKIDQFFSQSNSKRQRPNQILQRGEPEEDSNSQTSFNLNELGHSIKFDIKAPEKEE